MNAHAGDCKSDAYGLLLTVTLSWRESFCKMHQRKHTKTPLQLKSAESHTRNVGASAHIYKKRAFCSCSRAEVPLFCCVKAGLSVHNTEELSPVNKHLHFRSPVLNGVHEAGCWKEQARGCSAADLLHAAAHKQPPTQQGQRGAELKLN